jgi:hypothetical protein
MSLKQQIAADDIVDIQHTKVANRMILLPLNFSTNIAED